MELICPSCEARYRVPDGAIGAHGRQVSCTNCGHGWHAAPPLVLGPQARTAEPAMATYAEAPGALEQDAQAGQAERQPGRSVAADSPGPRATESRVAQLAEIREMIAQVQSDDRSTAAEAHGGRHAVDTEIGRVPNVHTGLPPARDAAGIGRTSSEPRRGGDKERDEALHQDPLRRRMAEHDARSARERDERERLRRSMRNRRPETRAGSGAFLSGFLLVVLVAAAMLATYLLHDEIIARVPESAPILTDYVDAMNDLRVSIAEGYEQARAWVMELIADVA